LPARQGHRVDKKHKLYYYIPLKEVHMAMGTKEVQKAVLLVRQGDITVEYGQPALILLDDESYIAAIRAIQFMRSGCPVAQIYIPKDRVSNLHAWDELADDITQKVRQIGLASEKFIFL
jgi:hypothetical protein